MRRTIPLNFPLGITVLSWGFNFVALKLLYRQLPPPAVALCRFALMYLLLVGLCKLKGESLRYGRDWPQLFILGFLAMGIYMIFFLEGMMHASAAEGAIILASAPIFTALIAIAFKQERFGYGTLGGALLAFAGVVLVIVSGTESGQSKVLGDVLILCSSVVWALSVVMSKPLTLDRSPLQILTLSMPGALLALLPYGLNASIEVPWGSLSSITWLMLFHITVLAGVLGFWGFYTGVKTVGGPAAMLYQFFVPPIAAFSAWLVFGKTLTVWQFVGMAVIIAGVFMSNRARNKGTLAIS